MISKIEMMKEMLEMVHSTSEGKQRLHVELALQNLKCTEQNSKIIKRLALKNPEEITEEQYEILKASYCSIHAEYIKILNILSK